jgi:hypothetical protein
MSILNFISFTFSALGTTESAPLPATARVLLYFFGHTVILSILSLFHFNAQRTSTAIGLLPMDSASPQPLDRSVQTLVFEMEMTYNELITDLMFGLAGGDATQRIMRGKELLLRRS